MYEKDLDRRPQRNSPSAVESRLSSATLFFPFQLEYAILLKKIDIVRVFVSVQVPAKHRNFHNQYRSFLKHYNEPYFVPNASLFYQTPIQRMLTTPECVPLVPLLLEQFVSDDGIDLSVIDDCLYARPHKNRCIFGRGKHFSTADWLEQHPLSESFLMSRNKRKCRLLSIDCQDQ